LAVVILHYEPPILVFTYGERVEPMNIGLEAQLKTAPKPSFTSLCGGILQRQCACAQHTIAGSECAECCKKLLALQRRAINQAEPAIVPPIGYDVLRSPGQPLDLATRAFMEPCFGHDFSRVRVCTAGPEMSQTKLSTNSSRDHLMISTDPQPPETTAPTETNNPPVSNPHPFTAIALEARTATGSCSVPSGQHGASKVIRFRIADFERHPVRGSLTVREQFTRLEGPEDIFRRLTPNLYLSERGFFNDCYRLFQPTPLPGDLRLKVEQNHLVSGEIASKNHIAFSPNNILVCVFPRPPRQHNFGTRCKIY
jgi:hypothetical protein